jgi:hypothetical protein
MPLPVQCENADACDSLIPAVKANIMAVVGGSSSLCAAPLTTYRRKFPGIAGQHRQARQVDRAAQDRQIVVAAQCLGITAAERRFVVARRRCPAAD